MKLDSLRREYLQGGLRREDLADDPFEQFEEWLGQAIAAELADPTAVTVATVDAEGQPSQRIVLLKSLDARGFVFYTNLGSRKARELDLNPRVGLHFPWHALERQVKVRGIAERVSTTEALAYFSSRPRESQLAAWASEQSRPVSSRQMLMAQFGAMKDKFLRGEVPLPDAWGGFRVVPHAIEFWQGGANRLHDRFEYTRGADSSWSIERLAP
ncbi:MAG: pyridoxamine 5'-phosphate oxidase [Pseudomonadota bacterium]